MSYVGPGQAGPIRSGPMNHVHKTKNQTEMGRVDGLGLSFCVFDGPTTLPPPREPVGRAPPHYHISKNCHFHHNYKSHKSYA